ncbi:hypothetical protein INR49_010343, partial [Caranx melampygus]
MRRCEGQRSRVSTHPIAADLRNNSWVNVAFNGRWAERKTPTRSTVKVHRRVSSSSSPAAAVAAAAGSCFRAGRSSGSGSGSSDTERLHLLLPEPPTPFINLSYLRSACGAGSSHQSAAGVRAPGTIKRSERWFPVEAFQRRTIAGDYGSVVSGINVMTESTETLQKYEELFAHRFTSEDHEYQQYLNRPADPPPMVEDWRGRAGGNHRGRDNRTVGGTEVVGGEEAEVGVETGAGEGTNVSSSTGTTETGTGVTA